MNQNLVAGFLYLRPALHLLPGPTSWAMITSQPVNGISYAPGAAGNSVAIICSDPASELPYCRGYRVTFVAWCSNSNSGSYFGISIDPDGYGYPSMG